MRNWQDLRYLARGTARQREAHRALGQLGILAVLQAYGPVLAGTIPLALDLPGSDLDLICQVPAPALPAFERLLRAHYGRQPGFHLVHRRWQELPTVVCRFAAEGFAWEVFGQPRPVSQQQAVRHLQVEHAVLRAGGAPWRRALRQLRARGLKTEPAFAQLLGLPGDPYAALLALEHLDTAALRALLPPLPAR